MKNVNTRQKLQKASGEVEKSKGLYDIQIVTPQRFLAVNVKSEGHYILIMSFSAFGRYKTKNTNSFEIGDVILLPIGCDTSFSCDEIPSSPIAIIRFSRCHYPWHSCEEPLAQWISDYLEDRDLPIQLHCSARITQELNSLFHILYEEHTANRPGGNAMTGILMGALLGQLARMWHFEQSNISGTDKAPHGLELVEHVKQIIAAEFAEPITLVQTASRCFVTSAYLSTLFHKSTGLTFTRYLNLTRINHALVLLLDTDELVVDIAISSGFSFAQHFNLTFKSLTGFTPLEYRRKFKSQI